MKSVMATEPSFCIRCLKYIEKGELDRLFYCEDPQCNSDSFQEDDNPSNLVDNLFIDNLPSTVAEKIGTSLYANTKAKQTARPIEKYKNT